MVSVFRRKRIKAVCGFEGTKYGGLRNVRLPIIDPHSRETEYFVGTEWQDAAVNTYVPKLHDFIAKLETNITIRVIQSTEMSM